MPATLDWPQGQVDVVLDTDAYNEIDDQFAIAYLLRSNACGRTEKLRCRALCAAPFHNAKSEGPADGMEKSYQEILKLLSLMGREEMGARVFRGSQQWLADEHTPADSPAAREIARLAGEYTPERPLYVAAIGALTNVASALLLAPAIAESIVVVWLGGNAPHWDIQSEFNLKGDVAAARAVFLSGAALVQLPCMGVVSCVTTTKPELECWLKGHSPLCDYLAQNTIDEAESYAHGKPWSRVIWDVATVAWLLGGMTRDRVVPRHVPTYDFQYAPRPDLPPMRLVYHVNRDALMEDLFGRLRDG
ncbi:MAG: nucleoside hydrolase [Oscillospiraceae bacterium]|nr:nucleoside hydrolase [Oscillospiraceae bacterium]